MIWRIGSLFMPSFFPCGKASGAQRPACRGDLQSDKPRSHTRSSGCHATFQYPERRRSQCAVLGLRRSVAGVLSSIAGSVGDEAHKVNSLAWRHLGPKCACRRFGWIGGAPPDHDGHRLTLNGPQGVATVHAPLPTSSAGRGLAFLHLGKVLQP